MTTSHHSLRSSPSSKGHTENCRAVSASAARLKLPLPVRILVLTTSDVSYHNELMSAAINQSKYQLYLNVKMDLDILVPWEHQTETVGTNVLLAETVIVGKVPQTYVEVE